MGKIDRPAVLASVQITLVSIQPPGGAPEPAARLQIQAVRPGSGGFLEEVPVPALHLQRAELLSLIEAMTEALSRLGPAPHQESEQKH